MDSALAIDVSYLAQQKALYDIIEKGGSDIQQFYKGANIFITGSSGFIGKQLVEKLVRSCDVKKIYLLLRSKKGMSAQERLEKICQNTIWDTLRKKQPNFHEKLEAVPGDVTELRLGICEQDWKRITEEVDIIIHVAATVNFDETLKQAVFTNVRGTREMIRFGKACKNIRSIVHVSTAFSHATLSRRGTDIAEAFYDTPIAPKLLIEMSENIESNILHDMTPSILKDWPNTYTFTKAVAEEIVRTMGAHLPICVVRPGIVIGSHREPSAGWVDTSCVYGPSGLMMGVGLGLLHVLYGVRDNRIDLVPLDYVNNAIIAAGWKTGVQQAAEKNIYTVSSTRNAILWEDILYSLGKYVKPVYPTNRQVYYPYYLNTTNKYSFLFLTFFLHVVPAYIFDFGAKCLGKSIRLITLYKKASKLTTLLSYFTCNSWRFLDDNLMKLSKSMSQTDRTIYNFDIACLDWHEQLIIWSIGIRKYMIKDGLKHTEYALKKQRLLKYLNYIVLALYCYLWYNVLYFIVHGLGFVFRAVFTV